MFQTKSKPGVTRDELKEYINKGYGTSVERRLAELRLEYSEIGTLRNTFLETLRGKERIYPTILPTQVTGRWRYINPPLSGFPKKCINPECPQGPHRKTEQCWSVRECILPDPGTFWVEHDLDAVEHRIYALILGWIERLDDLKAGIDIHTDTTCLIFNLPSVADRLNPHTSELDAAWRKLVSWQGKDDTRRTMSKNFTYGQGQYCYVKLATKYSKIRYPYRNYQGLIYTPTVVYQIPNINSYLILNPATGNLERPEYEKLAISFMENSEQREIQGRKALVMEQCRRDKYARNLYGGIRRAWFQAPDDAKKLFNSIVQGTVAEYVNESAILLQAQFPDSYLVHDKHDSLEWAFPYSGRLHRVQEEAQVLEECRKICQRTLLVDEYDIPITATFKIVRSQDGDS